MCTAKKMWANNICTRTGRWLPAILIILTIDGRNLATANLTIANLTFGEVLPCNENPCAYLVYVQFDASGPEAFGNLTSIVPAEYVELVQPGTYSGKNTLLCIIKYCNFSRSSVVRRMSVEIVCRVHPHATYTRKTLVQRHTLCLLIQIRTLLRVLYWWCFLSFRVLLLHGIPSSWEENDTIDNNKRLWNF